MTFKVDERVRILVEDGAFEGVVIAVHHGDRLHWSNMRRN